MKNKENEILIAAMSLLEEEGDLSSVNLRKTARRAGCAHTNIYNYYPSFEALKWAMLERALVAMHDYLFEKTSSTEDIRNIISRYIDFALEHPALYKLIWITELEPAGTPADTGFLNMIPARLISSMTDFYPTWPEEKCERKADLIHSYVHGKILNIIYRRIPSEQLDEEKKAALKVCSQLLHS